MISKNTKATLSLVFILALTILIYKDLPRTFFQQDEWHAFGEILFRGPAYITTGATLPQLLLGSTRPLARLFYYWIFGWAGTNAFWFGVASLFLHLINVSLAWVWIKLITRDWKMASIAATFFALGSVGSQAVTWFGNFSGTLPATTLTLFCLIFYFQFRQSRQKLWLVVSILSFITALLFKESALFLVVFMPTLDWFWPNLNLAVPKDKREEWWDTVRRTFVFWGWGGLIIFGRLWGLGKSGESAGRIISGGNFLAKIILHFFTYPVESLFQVVIPSSLTFALSDYLTPVWFSGASSFTNLDLFSEVVVAEILSLLLGIAFWLILLFAIIRWWSDKKLGLIARQMFLAGVFLALSLLPYVVINKPDAYLESRYYYLAMIGAGWLLVLVLRLTWSLFNEMKRLFVLLAFGLLLIAPVFYLRQSLQQQLKLAQIRKSILNQILTEHPHLTNRAVFYFTHRDEISNKSQKVELPFQSGLGQTLMVLYSEKGELNPEFFENEFLWDLGSQGYKEIDSKGFGYFDELSEIQAMVQSNKFSSEDLIVYNWNQRTGQLRDITCTFQLKIDTR